MAADLAHRSYISLTLLDKSLEGVPEVTQMHVRARSQPVVFKSKLVAPEGEEKTGWGWCYKSSWAQRLRIHEGDCLTHLQGLPNVVNFLVYGFVKVEKKDDTTVFGR